MRRRTGAEIAAAAGVPDTRPSAMARRGSAARRLPDGVSVAQLDAMLVALAAGGSLASAAGAAGIADSALRAWLGRGLGGDPDYAPLAQAVVRAEAEAQTRLLDTVMRAVTAVIRDPDASDARWRTALEHARWWVSRRHPQEWDTVRAAKAVAAQVQAVAVTSGFSPSSLPLHEQLRLLEAAAARVREELEDAGELPALPPPEPRS